VMNSILIRLYKCGPSKNNSRYACACMLWDISLYIITRCILQEHRS